MSIRVMTWVWDESRSRGTDRLVLLAIADSASDSGGNAWPAVATLARKAGVDERTVQRSVKRLVKLGELAVEPAAGQHGVNVYRVVMTPRQSATPAECHPRRSVTPGALSPPAERHPTNGADGTDDAEPPRQSVTPGNLPPRQSATQTVLSNEGSSSSPSTSSLSRKREKTPAPKGTRIPDDFTVTDEMVAWARQETPLVGAIETAKFVDYWRGVSGQRGVKADWVATWRNWMRKAQTDATERAGRGRPGNGGHQPYQNPSDPNAYEGQL